MKRRKYIPAIAMLLTLSCASPSVTTIWKSRDNHTEKIHSIVVAGVIGGDDTVIRRQIENQFSEELKKAGYNAIPASTAFGMKGLTDLGQEQTLIKLCNYGFDAVLTVALIDESKEKYNDPPAGSALVGNYYLDRIWNYHRIEAGARLKDMTGNYFWESVLYDLYALRPLSAIQTRLYAPGSTGTVDPALARTIIAKMVKQKIIKRRKGAVQVIAPAVARQ